MGLPTALGAWVWVAGFDTDGALLKDRPPLRTRASATSMNPAIIKNTITVKTVRVILGLETLSITFPPFFNFEPY
jgi:hypothetical protein